MTVKAGIVEPERRSIAEQRPDNHFPAAKNSNERVVVRQQVAKTDSRDRRKDNYLFEMVIYIRSAWKLV
jgi:hypothetical protein